MLCHWHWHHMMLTVLLIAPLHSLGQDNWNVVQHAFFHVMWLTQLLASCDVNSIINYTTEFLWSMQSKWGITWHFQACDIIISALVSLMPMALSIAPFYSLGQDDQNEFQHNFFSHVITLALALVSNDDDGIINGTTPFLKSRQSKWGATWHFWSCGAIGAATSIINGTIAFLRSRWNKSAEMQFFGPVTLFALALHDSDSTINGTISFIRAIIMKMKCNMSFLHCAIPLAPALKYNQNLVQHDLFWSCDTTGTSVGILWCQWHHQ